MRRDPLEGLLNQRWDFRCGGQMRALRLEAIGVGLVRQRDRLAVVAGVAETALRLYRLVLGAGIFQLTFLFGLDAVTGLIAPFVRPVGIGTILTLTDDRYRLVGGRCRDAGRQHDQGYLTIAGQNLLVSNARDSDTYLN